MQNDVDVAYFEVQLLKFEPGTKLAIGLVSDAFVLDNFPGTQSKSYGYHSTGEYWINGRRKGADLASCSANSVIGCGINYVTNQIFFTVDGKVEKVEEKVAEGKWFPCVALHAPGQRVRMNFGRERFRYNLQEKLDELRVDQMAKIDQVAIPSMSRLIFNYLLYYAYKETAEALPETATMEDIQPLTERDTRMLSTLELRAELRNMLFSGRVEDAKQALLMQFGDMVLYTEAMFALDCQMFIELIRKKETMAAIEFSQLCFPNWWCESTFRRIEECCSLLAYFVPEKAPAAYLLSQEHKQACFDLINRSILQWTNVFVSSSSFNDTSTFDQFGGTKSDTTGASMAEPTELLSTSSSHPKRGRSTSSRSSRAATTTTSSSARASTSMAIDPTTEVATSSHSAHPPSLSSHISEIDAHASSLTKAHLPCDEPDLHPLLLHFLSLRSQLRSHQGGGALFDLNWYTPSPPTTSASNPSSSAPSTSSTPSILKTSAFSSRTLPK